jgi:hypothetical protein
MGRPWAGGRVQVKAQVTRQAGPGYVRRTAVKTGQPRPDYGDVSQHGRQKDLAIRRVRRSLIFATITISAILTVIMTLRTPRRRADDEPRQDRDSGRSPSPEIGYSLGTRGR